ncbi:MAG: hypothetical protein WAM66_02790 [Acidobacteriaceae bacterium]
MKLNGIRWSLACLGVAILAAPAAFAQQQSATSDQYQGVSQPPPDDTIVTTPDTPPPAVHATTPKPSPDISVAPPPPSSADRSDVPVITTGPSNDNSRWNNTDFGIVTVPVPQGEDDPQNPPDTAVLRVRDNSYGGMVSHATGSPNELPQGTIIRVRINRELSTTSTVVESPFEGRVMYNVINNGSVIIPAGSTLRGRVTQVSQGHRIGPAATLRLLPQVVILPDGTAYHLDAEVIESDAAGTRTGSEGGIKPSTHLLKKTAEYGIGAGTGAMVGAEIAGPPGALLGSVAGAGLITTHLLVQPPQDVVIPAESEIVFSLTQPLDLIPTRN